MKLLLDTNVLIDYFVRREPFFKGWTALRTAEAFSDVELWVSAKSYTDIFYVAHRAVNSKALQNAFEESMAFFKICSLTSEDIRHATEMAWDDFEDCLMYVAAEKVKADCLVTRDKAGFIRAKIPTKSVEETLVFLHKEHGLSFEALSL